MANIIGNRKDNDLTGTAGTDLIKGKGGHDLLRGLGSNDVIRGNGGNDVIEGGAGADELHGGKGIDTLSYAGSGEGVFISLGVDGSIDTAAKGDAEGDSGDGFENVSGSAFDDFVRGNESANVLKGRGGNDSLFANGGKDKIFGGSGDDWLDGGSGADLVHGGGGDDMVTYQSSAAGVNVSLGKNGKATVGHGGDAEGDTIRKVEGVTGSQHADVLKGNNLDNALVGNNGNDVLRGKGGDDLLAGGGGDDLLVGGGGDDTYEFSFDFGHDTIKGFKAGAGSPDAILIRTALLSDFDEALASSTQVGDDVVIAIDAGNSITLKDVLKTDLHQDDFLFF